jgi:hypothetical protein
MEVLQRQELSQSCGETQALLRPGERRVEILFHRWQDGCFRLAEARKCTRGTFSITVLGWRKMARLRPNDGFYTIPVMADILVMYSTVEGFYSWRNPKEGGYFVQALVKLLRKYNRTKDLLTILTFVNREVAVNFVSESEDPHYDEQKQMCSIVSMLTRLVYFDKKCDT